MHSPLISSSSPPNSPAMASIESANSAPEAFRRRDMPEVCLSPGPLLDEDEFRIDGAVLDHGIPCLAFVFEEKLRVNVWSKGLRRLGLQTGPWLREAKRGVRQGAPDDSQISIHGDLSVPLGVLRQHACTQRAGTRLRHRWTPRQVSRP